MILVSRLAQGLMNKETNMESRNLPTIEQTDTGLVVTSDVVAEGTGTEHENVLELLDRHKTDFQPFGAIAFQKRPSTEGNRTVRTAMLNELQSTVLMTYMPNSERVVRFRIALVQAFYQKTLKLTGHSQAPLFSEDFSNDALGLSIGAPVPEIPTSITGTRLDPRTIRNDRIAHAARDAKGRWVPITIRDFNKKQYAELAKAISYGTRRSFSKGDYQGVAGDGQLYIKHVKTNEPRA
ncbi:hypothetical protein A6F49_14555 [Enteractinococcus helveticum]|uniref:Uncharacterized protein n=2 Tax=Enteractinococcus helveticum TaxID=1837282 RepID=A0A1B7LXV2_9MICC|nr:hypothetical protein A6F49_14555 [Enteractinococcus helveticum]